MSKLAELLQEREALDQAIQAARKEEVQQALATIRELVERFELTSEDIFPSLRHSKKTAGSEKRTVAPKYRDPKTGATWTGRGKPPKWIEGKDRSEFAI